MRAQAGYRVKRASIPKLNKSIPNLLQRQLPVTQLNKIWVADITYIQT